MRTIELLAPAKNLECGIEAIRHGADAVYIGAGRFGARAAAGNPVDDIRKLAEYAHFFRAKVYVALNTILKDSELNDAEKLAWELYEAGADALIVQDMGLLKLHLPPIPLHASTQMDNRTVEKVRFLQSAGFEQAVLARELSLTEIAGIHKACPDMKLEVFVHGALCVSYSGQCYISEHCFGRSANRGECAQVCRMSFDLEDDEGNKIVSDKHLLSLKDMCLLDDMEKLIESGATSFKIEGRLKDVAYVKNVTAAYSRRLNEIISRHKGKYARSSSGKSEYKFTPDVNKSFNRGFTNYFLYGRNDKIFSFDTPKALGEFVGTVKDTSQHYFTVAGTKTFSNGDGLCFIGKDGKLHGFRVNKVENGKLYPFELQTILMPKTRLYRNRDNKFDQILAHDSAERFIPVDICIDETENGFALTIKDDDGCEAHITAECPKELARTHQSANVTAQLAKLGGTGFKARNTNIAYTKNWFIPSSKLSAWRRELVEKMTEERRTFRPQSEGRVEKEKLDFPSRNGKITYLGNVMNSEAEKFYKEHGAKIVEPAFEKEHREGAVVMFCRHCIRYSMGWCLKRQHNSQAYRGPLYLTMDNGMRFKLEFDCAQCIMKVCAMPEQDR